MNECIVTLPYAAMHAGKAVLQIEGYNVEKINDKQLRLWLKSGQTIEEVVNCLDKYYINCKSVKAVKLN